MMRRAIAVLLSIPLVLIVSIACRDILAPGRQRTATKGASLLNPAGRVVVYPGNMRGWVFYNDQNGTGCSGSACQLVAGPSGQPGGLGSAELSVGATSEGKALILPDYQGTRLDAITSLRYSTYRQTSDAGNNLAIALQFNVDFDLTDASGGYQGRLVYEPYMGVGGNVPATTWQLWDARSGKWWGTKTTVTVGNASVSNSCVQSNPCTWPQLLQSFPNLGVHATYGAVVLKAGSGWANFRGNIDNLVIGVDSVETTFDFELEAPAVVPASAPDSVPTAWLLPERINWNPDSLPRPLYSELIVLQFREGTTLTERENAVAAVGAQVVGGQSFTGAEGFYMLRVPDDSTGRAVRDAVDSLRTRSSIGIVSPNFLRSDVATYRRPDDGPGRRPSDWYLNADSAFGGNTVWAASSIRAPFAWGCASGLGVRVAVLDYGHFVNSELQGRVMAASVTYPNQAGFFQSHGQRVASVLAATANNGAGVAGIAHESQLLLLDAAQRLNGQMAMDSANNPISTDFDVFVLLQRARLQRARVVNISLGTSRTSAPSAADLLADQKFITNAIHALTDYREEAPPLIVLAAGNNGSSSHPEWGSYGLFADSLPLSTLVVAAGSRTRNQPMSLATGSGKIDLWAPGEDVATFSASGGVALESGASFAAPLASGTAALMLQQDSTLTAEDLKQHIVASADSSRGVAGKPFLDSYAALKAVAERSGTPLCGNRLWSLGSGTLFAHRGQSAAEALFTVPGDPYDLAYVNVHHGGRRIETAFFERFVLVNGTWVAGNWSVDDEREYSGAFKSSGAWFQDHDDSVSTTISAQQSASTVSLVVSVHHLRGGLPVRQVNGQVAVSLSNTFSELCVREEADTLGVYHCIQTDSAGTKDFLSGFGQLGVSANHLHALDPQGRFVIAPLVTMRRDVTFASSFGPCSDAPGLYPGTRCREMTSNVSRSLRSQLVRVELSSGAAFIMSAPSLIEGAVGDEIWWLAINEEGTEVVLQVGNINGAGAGICTNGRHEWLTIPGNSSTPAELTFIRNVPGSWICDGYLDGTGTTAALRTSRP